MALTLAYADYVMPISVWGTEKLQNPNDFALSNIKPWEESHMTFGRLLHVDELVGDRRDERSRVVGLYASMLAGAMNLPADYQGDMEPWVVEANLSGQVVEESVLASLADQMLTLGKVA